MLHTQIPFKSLAEFYDQNGNDILQSHRNAYASRYDQLAMSSTLTYVESLVPPPSGEPARFLDLCCGTGVWSIKPARIGYEVWGVDFSAKSIEAARWLAEANEVADRCHFQINDVLEYLGSTTLAFDVIFVSGSLYYLDLDQALPLLVQHLKPGGSFICIETNGSNFIMNAIRRIRNVCVARRDPLTLSSLLRRRSYRKIAAYFDTSETRFLDCLTLASGLFSWNKALGRYFHAVAGKLDYFLLNVLGLQCLAFKIVFRGQRPRSADA